MKINPLTHRIDAIRVLREFIADTFDVDFPLRESVEVIEQIKSRYYPDKVVGGRLAKDAKKILYRLTADPDILQIPNHEIEILLKLKDQL